MSLAEQFRLVVGTHTFRARDVLSGVTITWGRGSLYDTPKKRVLSAEVSVPIDGLFPTARDMTARTATAYLGSELLFTGSLADVATRRIDDTRAALKFSAHETTGMNPLLETVIESAAVESHYLVDTIAIQVPKLRVTIEDKSARHRAIKNAGGWREVMVKDLCEALACPAEISRPAWSPDYRTVRSTTYRPPARDAEIVTIPAGSISIEPPTFSLKNFPPRIKYNLGTVWGDKDERHEVLRLGLPGEIEIPVPVHWKDFSDYRPDSVAIRDAQLSDPLVIRLSDAHTPDPRLFTTWETPSRVIKTTDFDRTRSPLLLTAKSLAAVLIGGQLTFTSTEVTHRARALYVPLATAPAHHTYRQLSTPYRNLNGKYKEL